MDGEETTVASEETTTDETAATSESTDAEVTETPEGEEVAESSDRPEWLPEKFKTPEDFAKSYGELEAKQSGYGATEQKAELLDRMLKNPQLLSQFNNQNPNQQQQGQPQVAYDEQGFRTVSEEQLKGFTFENTRELLREDMRRMLQPFGEMLTGWTGDKKAASEKQELDAIFTKYPALKENEALEERMASRISVFTNQGRKLDEAALQEAYDYAEGSLKKELETLRASVKQETEDAKKKSGDVNSPGSVSTNKKAKTMSEAFGIAKSKLGT